MNRNKRYSGDGSYSHDKFINSFDKISGKNQLQLIDSMQCELTLTFITRKKNAKNRKILQTRRRMAAASCFRVRFAD